MAVSKHMGFDQNSPASGLLLHVCCVGDVVVLFVHDTLALDAPLRFRIINFSVVT